MSDLNTLKKNLAKKNPEFWDGYEDRFATFKLGVLLKQARKEAGLTQQQVAEQLRTTKSVISRMENHAKDIRLSTLEKFARAVGRDIHVTLR
jgi:ribosome-binding protein aMBF1 (putative translation factor)